MKNKKLLTRFFLVAFAAVLISTITLTSGNQPLYQPRTFTAKYLSQDIKGAMQWLSILRCDPATGTIDPTMYLQARKMVELLQANSAKAIGLTWKELGPDNVGGRCRALLIDKDNPTIMYAGGVGGGLWRSTTSGTSWVKVSSISDNLAISCIAQGPNGEIYAGTGEGLSQPSGINFNTGQMGGGIYKSTDGINFSVLTATKPTLPITSSNPDWALINRVAVSPTTGYVFAATNTALKMSMDHGTDLEKCKENSRHTLHSFWRN